MLALIFGSSLARDIRDYDQKHQYLIAGYTVTTKYACFRGKSYEYFIDHPWEFDEVLKCKPDLIVVIFGANSISTKLEKKDLLINCRTFYELLRAKVDIYCSKALVIAHQLPLRFVYDNSHDTPDPATFKRLRDYVNQKVRTLRTVDYILPIAGSDWTRLDHEEYFRDGIHFECFAIEIQFELILKRLEFILSQQN